MLDVSLLQKFYTQATEHDLATLDNSESYDVQEYDQHMINIRQALRFFYELETKDNNPY